VYVTVADALPAVAVPIVGAAGLVPATTELDEADVAEPNSVDAETVKVYACPAVRPVALIGLVPVNVRPPGLDVAVYVGDVFVPVAPGVNGTSIALSTFCTITAVPIVGADGPTPITSGALTADVVSVPFEDTAVTVNVLVEPCVNPVTIIGLLLPVAV
jgi:hypothetical protein